MVRQNFEKMNFCRMELLYNFGSRDYRYAFSAKDDRNCFYAIPVCSGDVMKYNVGSNEIKFLGPIEGKNYEYTGGAFDAKRRCIWGFPRNSNKLLKVDVDKDKLEEISLDVDYKCDGIHDAHHYSGVLAGDYIYCPPRNKGEGILKIDLDSYKTYNLPIPCEDGAKLHFSGSILHPDGKVYFLPSGSNAVTVMDLKTEEIEIFPEKAGYMNFGGDVWVDGNIYCVCDIGVIKIDVKNKETTVVNKFRNPERYYGALFHPNGKLYACGFNNDILEFDPGTSKVRIAAKQYDIQGGYSNNTIGQIMDDGNLYLTPCQGRFFTRCWFE